MKNQEIARILYEISAMLSMQGVDFKPVAYQKAAKEAKIGKKVHPHTLRHSFATHLIENGNSVSDVQVLLGHKSPETTMVYVHMATENMIKIKSPLDGL